MLSQKFLYRLQRNILWNFREPIFSKKHPRVWYLTFQPAQVFSKVEKKEIKVVDWCAKFCVGCDKETKTTLFALWEKCPNSEFFLGPTFRLNTEIYRVNLHIQFKEGKIQSKTNSQFGIFSLSVNVFSMNKSLSSSVW